MPSRLHEMIQAKPLGPTPPWTDYEGDMLRFADLELTRDYGQDWELPAPTIFVFASDCFGRLLYGLIYIAKQASAQYLGSRLHSPEHIVRPGERLGGVVV